MLRLMKLLSFFLKGEILTTKQVAERFPEVHARSLYRDMDLLVRAGWVKFRLTPSDRKNKFGPYTASREYFLNRREFQ